MPAEIRIEGDPAAQLRKLARDLKVAGSKELQRELRKNLREAARPMIESAKRSAAESLPQGGGRGVRSFNRATGARMKKLKKKGFAYRGVKVNNAKGTRIESLAQRVVHANYRIKTAGRGRNFGLVLQATNSAGRKINLNRLDKGTFRHPLFGNRGYWYDQQVAPGWWTVPMEANKEVVAAAVIKAVDTMTTKLNESLF